jgi:hypothetical protein
LRYLAALSGDKTREDARCDDTTDCSESGSASLLPVGPIDVHTAIAELKALKLDIHHARFAERASAREPRDPANGLRALWDDDVVTQSDIRGDHQIELIALLPAVTFGRDRLGHLERDFGSCGCQSARKRDPL